MRCYLHPELPQGLKARCSRMKKNGTKVCQRGPTLAKPERPSDDCVAPIPCQRAAPDPCAHGDVWGHDYPDRGIQRFEIHEPGKDTSSDIHVHRPNHFKNVAEATSSK